MTSSANVVMKPAQADHWLPIEAINFDTLAGATAETLNLAQWLVRISNSYVPGLTQEVRTEIGYRTANSSFITKTFESDVALEMRLPSLEMQFIEGGSPAPHILDPENHSPAQVEAWLLVELLHRGIDRSRFSKKLPYTISDLMMGDAEKHSPEAYQDGLRQLAAWFQNAATVLEAAARAVGIEKARLVCLPQTLSLTCVYDSKGEVKRAGFGFSPADAHNHEPFFYTSAAAGRGSGGKGAILKASQLLAESDPAGAAISFLEAAGR